MRPTFYTWLHAEIRTRKMALVMLYETQDHMLYVEAPPLRQKYMELFGAQEEDVLQAELETSMLRRKLELIQAAVNRREPIDLEAIEAGVEEEKQKKIRELEREDITLEELPQLSEEDQKELQTIYRDITSRFHPEINKKITETQKDLYQKAVEAYKMQNLDAMKLIYEMLNDTGRKLQLEFTTEAYIMTEKEAQRSEYRKLADSLATDYTLVKKVYPAFIPLEEDQLVLEGLDQYEELYQSVDARVDEIRAGFPFNAADVINSPEKAEDYRAELRIRQKRAEEERAELEVKISNLLETNVNG